MKVSRIKIKNMFGIKEFEADLKDLELAGDNGTGKTSFIDAIRYALNNKSNRDYIVRNGESEGEVIVETDSGINIMRKSRINKVDYKSIKDQGKDVQSPESFLRSIFTELQLNPVEFLSMSKQEQNRIILDLIDFEWNLGWIKEQFGEIVPEVNYEQNILGVLFDIQKDDGYYFKKRQDINRDIRNNQAFVEEIGATLPKDYDAYQWEKVNLGDRYKQIAQINDKNNRIQKAQEIIQGQEEKLAAIDNEMKVELNLLNEFYVGEVKIREKKIEELRKQIESLENGIKRLGDEHKNKADMVKLKYDNEKSEFKAELVQYADVARIACTPTTHLQEEAEHIEKMKSYINEYKRMVGLLDDIKKLKSESEELTEKIEKARTLPGEILEQSSIPIKDLSIKDGMPLIKGLPVSNLSDGEKLDLCINVAISKPNALNIVLIDGIEKLSKGNRSELYKHLKEKGVQFISTRTTDDKNLTVIAL